jgi:DNA-binding GntR family transcriptional regulator
MGLNTIRGAQQLLVEEGMLETRQGVGVFVTSTESLRQVDVVGELTPGALAQAIEHLAQAIEHLADVVATTATH